uniref:Theileria-specific sub-telomeric protein, putative n=1 Tax=Theileria annulata TaxID=5874 RepID=A0A3B0NIE9_THEAN
MAQCTCTEPAGAGDKCVLLNAAYILAGLAMMLNIRLSYSSAPYALIRFRLPENLFSVFVRRMASSLELWCLPGFVIADIMDLVVKALYNNTFFKKTVDQLKAKAATIKVEAGKLYQRADLLANASNLQTKDQDTPQQAELKQDLKQLATTLRDAVGQNESSGLQQALNDLSGAIEGREKSKAEEVITKYNDVAGKYKAVEAKEDKYKEALGTDETIKYTDVKSAWNAFNKLYHDAISPPKFYIIIVSSIIAQWLNFVTYVILFFVYRGGGDQGHLTRFYWVIAASGFVFGISNPLVYAVDWNYISIYIVGENCFPALTSFIHYLATLMFGNRRKWNSDYLLVYIDIVVAIIISFVAAVVWTLGYAYFKDGPSGYEYGHIFTFGFGGTDAKASTVAPLLIVLVGMGIVYAIYPGIAPGMIVPFYLIDKIEMVLLVATIFPPIIVAMVNKFAYLKSPKSFLGWEGDNWGWHFFDLVIPIMIILAYIFIYSLHYRDSNISLSIVNQPKMSTALTIIFYMCHEISLAVGFAGMVGNAPEWTVIAQLVGAFLMVFLALYSEGYIIEYKSHYPTHWPTEGMTPWKAFCYWFKTERK